MAKIRQFKTKEDIAKDRIEQIELENQDIIADIEARNRRLDMKTDNGIGMSQDDFDQFICDLATLGNITDQKVDAELEAGLITQEEAKRKYRGAATLR